MTPSEIASIESAGRSTFGWAAAPEAPRPSIALLFAALVPAAGIIAAAAFLLAAF